MAGHVRHSMLKQLPRQSLRTAQRTGLRSSAATQPRRGLLLGCSAAATANAGSQYVLHNGLVDYYEVLGVDDDAAIEEIKKAYRTLAKECHPDYLGDKGHNICIMLNEAYQILSNPTMRSRYDAQLEEALADEDQGYTGQPLSKWMPAVSPAMAKNENPAENRAVFVDEITCIGCKNCVWCAPATFRLEQEHGRSRVFAQWLDTEDSIQTAIDSCPVSCIHWVEREDLPALEYVMQNKLEPINVGVMMAGQGNVPDVFDVTATFKRQRREAEEARARDKRYSGAQQEARRRAAEELAKQHLGFFAGFSEMFASMQASVQSAVEGVGFERVGARKRRQHWYERDAARRTAGAISGGGGDGYSVPPELSLVPISVYARKEDI